MELGGVGVVIKYISFFITPTSSPFGATPPQEENYPYPPAVQPDPFPRERGAPRPVPRGTPL